NGVRRAILGVRPSDLEYDPHAAPSQSFELNVVVSEYIGAQSVLICDCGGDKVTVELKSETPIALGETLRFGFRPDGLHLFDPDSEMAL
ncbi:MAG: TOBE domain-containing protein, partial [Pseudomonadota bacterium]